MNGEWDPQEKRWNIPAGKNLRPAYDGAWLIIGNMIYVECMRAQLLETNYTEIVQIILAGIRINRGLIGRHRVYSPQLLADISSLG